MRSEGLLLHQPLRRPVSSGRLCRYVEKAGGTWKGKVVQGKLPEDSDDYKVLASSYSEPLTKLVYNMNKYSDNIIARQLFLALANTQKDEPKNLEGARAAVYEWAASLKIPASSLKIDNGSGLSRTTAVSTDAFVTVLKHMWNSPQMPEFVSSLPISGVDGTMRKDTSLKAMPTSKRAISRTSVRSRGMSRRKAVNVMPSRPLSTVLPRSIPYPLWTP